MVDEPATPPAEPTPPPAAAPAAPPAAETPPAAPPPAATPPAATPPAAGETPPAAPPVPATPPAAEKPPAGLWPDNWRELAAGDDKKTLDKLGRYTDIPALVKKLNEQDALLSSGKLKAVLPKDATPEQLAEYRKANSIPESVEKYDLTMADGLVIGEADKPIINNMLKTMHGENLNNDTAKSLIAAYYAEQKRVLQEREVAIDNNNKAQDDILHKEWGGNYRDNMTAYENHLQTYSESARNTIKGGYDENGMPLAKNAEFIRNMVAKELLINPLRTVAGIGATDQMTSVESEIKTIEKRMVDDSKGYYKDEKQQGRLRELYEWRDRQQKKIA